MLCYHAVQVLLLAVDVAFSPADICDVQSCSTYHCCSELLLCVLAFQMAFNARIAGCPVHAVLTSLGVEAHQLRPAAARHVKLYALCSNHLLATYTVA